MSDETRNDGLPIEPAETPVAEEASIAPGAPAREASVRLRAGDGSGDASLMDPANESLADALKITFKLVQFAMVVLASAFVLSGLQQVEEGERGLSLLFGKPRALDLEPGFRFSAPYPFGELVKVQTGLVTPAVNQAFWPDVGADRLEDPVEEIGTQRELVPGEDGSVITADLNLAHAQWRLSYRRARVAELRERLLPEAESAVILRAFERAVVQAVSQITIDEMLRPEGGTRDLARRVQEITQSMLDRVAGVGPTGEPLGVGIVIEEVILSRKIPPTTLIDRFAAVNSARTNAQAARTDAEAARAEALNGVAGLASAALLAQIDKYEAAIETSRTDDAEMILVEIDRLLEGDGTTVAASGEVAGLLANAESERSAAVNAARADLALFEAKLAQFGSNPKLMVSRDWASAYADFLDKPFVQTMRLPTDVSPMLVINEDPDIIKEIDRQRKRAEAIDAAQRREDARRLDRFRSERGIIRDEE
ncbi:MAG: SPFH domain-containing protein [Planctomycetota bacterium]